MIRSSERRTTTRPAGGRSHVSPPHAAKPAATPTPPRERKQPRASSYSYFRSFFPSKKTPVHPSPSPVRRPAPETDRTQRRDALEQMRSRSSAASRIAASLRSLRDRFAGTRTRPNKVSPMPPPRPATVTTLPSPTRTPTRPRDPRSPRTTTPRRPPSFTLEPPTPSTPAVVAETTPTEETPMEETLMPTPTPTPPTSPQRTRATPPPRRRIHVRVGTPPREPVEHPPAPPPPTKEEVVEDSVVVDDADEEAAFVSEDIVEEEEPKTVPADPTPKSPVRNRVPIREMKAALAAAGLDTRECVEREDLEALYGALNSSKRPRIEITDEDENLLDDLPDDVPDDVPSTSFDLFDALPSEVNELVLRELSPRSLARATGVNRAWRSAASRDELWAKHLPPRPRTRGTKPKPKPAQTFNTRRVHTHHHERRELMREYAAKRELGGRWREGMFSRCDFCDHARPVECVKFVDHVPGLGRVCVTGGWDGRVFAYACDETVTRGTGWELLRRFEGCEGGWVASLIASPRCVVAGGTDGKICAWTFGSSEPTREFTQGGSVTKIVFVPNRKGEDDVLVAAASTDGDVVVWDLVRGTRLATLRGHLDAVWHVSPLSTELDGTVTLLTSSRDSTLRLWRFGDVDTDELLDVPRGIDGERVIAPATTWRDHDDAILSMTVSDPPSESCVNVGFGLGFTRLCATCGADGKIVVRDVATGVVLTTLTTSHATSHAGNEQAIRAPMCATFFEWPEDPAAFTVDVDSSRDGTRSRRIRPDRGDPHRRRTFLWLAAGYRVGNVGEVCLWDPVGGVLAVAMSDHGQPVSDVVVTEHALITVAPTDGVIVYTRNGDGHDNIGDVNGDTSGNSKGNACPVSAAVTVLDGAGSDGFSSCAGVCGDALAVGSKTGSVQLLDFRPNHRP